MVNVSPVTQLRNRNEMCAHVHEWIVDGDDKDLSRAFQGFALEVAGNVRVGARRA